MDYKKCDGFVAVIKCGSDKTMITTTLPGDCVGAHALRNLRRRVDRANFEAKVDVFDIIYEAGKIFIFAVIDMAVHSKRYLNERLNELVGFIRRSHVIRDPIICHVRVPIPKRALA